MSITISSFCKPSVFVLQSSSVHVCMFQFILATALNFDYLLCWGLKICHLAPCFWTSKMQNLRHIQFLRSQPYSAEFLLYCYTHKSLFDAFTTPHQYHKSCPPPLHAFSAAFFCSLMTLHLSLKSSCALGEDHAPAYLMTEAYTTLVQTRNIARDEQGRRTWKAPQIVSCFLWWRKPNFITGLSGW